MNQGSGKKIKTKNFNGNLTGAAKIKADMTKGTVEAEASKKLINNVDELLKVEDRVIYRITGKTLPWSFGQKLFAFGVAAFVVILLTGTIVGLSQAHNTYITNTTMPAVFTPTVLVPAATIDTEDDMVDAVTYVDKPSAPSVSAHVESVDFDVPGRDEAGLMTIVTNNNWRLPYNENGWWIKVEVNGEVVWYPEYSKMDDFAQYPIDLSPEKKADIGAHNPANMAFAFMSTDGQPHKVRVSYWSKSGSI